MDEELLTYEQAGKILGLQKTTIRKYVKLRKIPVVRFGTGASRIKREDLRAFIDTNRHEAA